MNAATTVPAILFVLLAISAAVLIAGIVMAAKGTGRVKTAGWWVAIVASLFVVAWGVVLLMGGLLGG